MNPENIVIEPVPIDDKPFRNIGYSVLLLTFGVFGIWSYFAPIDGSAFAQGVVTVKSHRKTVQHLDGGIVKKLIAKDGDYVNAGDVLLILDDTQINAQLEIVKGQLITLLAIESRLLAEREGIERIAYSKSLNDLKDFRIAEAKKSQEEIFSARKSTINGEISVLKQRIIQLNTKIHGLRKQQHSKHVLLNSYKEEISDLRELLAEGFADKKRLRDLERNYAKINGDIAELESEIAENEILVGETQLRILQLKKQFREEVVGKLGEVQSQLYDVNERFIAFQDKAERTIVHAPVQGTVLGMSVHTEGGVIAAGKPILDIVPKEEELIIDAKVNPLDIDRVSIGLKAEVRLIAFKQRVTPSVEGRVVNLSADSLYDEKTNIFYYRALVELLPESERKLSGLTLLPGMPAEVLINTGERTLFEYLIQPVSDAFARAFIED